jgi:hypothetical protein
MDSTALRAAPAASRTRDHDHVVTRHAAASVVEAVMYALRIDGRWGDFPPKIGGGA